MSKSKKSIGRAGRTGAVMVLAASILVTGGQTAAAETFEVTARSGFVSASASTASQGEQPITEQDVKISKDQAVGRLLEFFPDLQGAEINSARLTSGGGQGQNDKGLNPAWEIQFSIRKGNTYHGSSATVDAMNGDMLQVHIPIWPEDVETSFPPKFTRTQALEKAKSFVAEAAPSLKGQTLIEETGMWGAGDIYPLFGPAHYTFYFQTSREGIKIAGQYVYVTMDGNGKVTSFNYNGTRNDFPPPKPALTAAQAQERWEKDLQLQLVYATSDYRSNPDPDKWKLIYSPVQSLIWLDAQTGEWKDHDGKRLSTQLPEYVKLPKPAKPYVPRAVTAEEAARMVEAYADIPEGYTLTYHSLQKGMGGNPDTIQLQWSKQNSDFYGGRHASINAQTGQLVSFSILFYGPNGPETEDLSREQRLPMEQAVKLADEWMTANVPNAAMYRRVVENSSSEEDSVYTTVKYQLFHNDLPVQGHIITVSYNGQGKIVYLSARNWLSPESLKVLEQLKPALPPEKAKELYINSSRMELSYVRYGGHYTGIDYRYVEPSVVLAYTVGVAGEKRSDYQVLDAVSGEWVDFYVPMPGSYTGELPEDARDHWASAALQTLLQHGVIKPDEDGKLHPDRAVKVGKFLQMLALAANPHLDAYGVYADESQPKPFADVDGSSPYYHAVNHLIDQKLLAADPEANLHPEAELTRDELAVYLSKITGYSKLAPKLADLPVFTSLKDADQVPHPGAAALALKLGLMLPQNGQFQPEAKVTLAQLATVFVRLAEGQGEWDRKLSR